VEEEIWVCKDGRRLRVGEMSLEHLQHTLRMIIRTQRRRKMLREDLKALAVLFEDDDEKWGDS
jgi:hypothetical protein